MNTNKPGGDRREVRDSVPGIELRAAAEGSRSIGTMVGYAAVFDRYSADLGYFREKIQRGAFARAIASSDVRALANHDPGKLLGRKSAGTLRLAEDEIGLRVEIDLPDTSAGRDTAEEIRRGDMQGQSFSFTTNIDQWDWSGEVAIRTVIEVDQLYDVGPVTFPAYEDTTAAMRAFRSQQEARSATPPPAAPATSPAALESDCDQARLRLLEVS